MRPPRPRRPAADAPRPDEAATVRLLADMTGLPEARIIRLVTADPVAQLRFQLAVALATGEWEWLDGTGTWRSDPVRQQEKFCRYAASLIKGELCEEDATV